MNVTEFAAKIQLHPRAIVMLGTIEIRNKMGGSLPGTTPHYAMAGCPIVQRNGNVIVEDHNAAEIEFHFQETGFPLPSASLSYSPKQGNIVQLMFGRAGMAPTQNAYRILFEASAKINQMVSTKRQVFLVSLPILTPGKMGVTTGRHYLLGIFETNGTPIWIHPDALQNVLKAEFPADQMERSTAATAAPAVPESTHAAWYEDTKQKLASSGLKGHALHTTILRNRALFLQDKGIAPSYEAGLALVADTPMPPDVAADAANETPANAKTTTKAAAKGANKTAPEEDSAIGPIKQPVSSDKTPKKSLINRGKKG